MNKTPYIWGDHHRKICKVLDKVIAGEEGYNKVIINIAPRYGKTLLVSQMFIAYGFAKNPQSKFLHLSYSGSLTQDNSIAVKDIINSEYYQAVFDTRLRVGSNTKSKWDTEQGGGEYATSTLGQITGFGAGQTDTEDEESIDEYTARFNPNKFAGAIVIDDPIKPEDALSDNIREQVNRRFETTIRNRVNSRKTPIVIIMQRLHEHDLCGYLQDVEPYQWHVLSLPCLSYDENGQEHALWEFKHSVEELHKLRDINPFVFETQYMQNPKPMEGLMYREFRTYDQLPDNVGSNKGKMKCCIDSADVGSDYLCAICYFENKHGMWITDVLFTQKPMEFTEPETAKMLAKNNVEHCIVESNGAGRIFMRNVERISREYGNNKTWFQDKETTKNKEVRIFTHSNEVNNLIYMPSYWAQWHDFHSQIVSFRKVGRNAHDDAVDCLTQMVENFGKDADIVSDAELEADFL